MLFGLICWPCIILYIYKNGESDTLSSEASDSNAHNNSHSGGIKSALKSLTRSEMKRFLMIGFFKKKKNTIKALTP